MTEGQIMHHFVSVLADVATIDYADLVESPEFPGVKQACGESIYHRFCGDTARV